jgi:hypothetical protein
VGVCGDVFVVNVEGESESWSALPYLSLLHHPSPCLLHLANGVNRLSVPTLLRCFEFAHEAVPLDARGYAPLPHTCPLAQHSSPCRNNSHRKIYPRASSFVFLRARMCVGGRRGQEPYTLLFHLQTCLVGKRVS